MGLFVGMISCMIIIFNGWVMISGSERQVMSICMMLPCVVDGLLQKKTMYESNNRRRMIVGFLAGYGMRSIAYGILPAVWIRLL